MAVRLYPAEILGEGFEDKKNSPQSHINSPQNKKEPPMRLLSAVVRKGIEP